MKKLSIGTLALLIGSATFASTPSSSTIILTGGGDVAPASTMSLPLAALLKDVHYDVTCQVVNSNSEAVDMRFQPNGSHLSLIFGLVYLNGELINNLQGSVKSGENTVTVNELSIPVNGDASTVSLQFKNLDFNNTVQVNHCEAKPSIQKPIPIKGGHFVVYNNTGAYVDIAVGNFFPTPYLLRPYDTRWVDVSTNNQNIYIDDIF